MTITSSGMVCDICEKYILLENAYELSFNVVNEGKHLDAHKKCYDLTKEAFKNNTWSLMPEGKLKKMLIESGYIKLEGNK